MCEVSNAIYLKVKNCVFSLKYIETVNYTRTLMRSLICLKLKNQTRNVGFISIPQKYAIHITVMNESLEYSFRRLSKIQVSIKPLYFGQLNMIFGLTVFW